MFYHLVLSVLCERQGRNSTGGEQIRMLVSFPAWSHLNRDCCCIMTPSTGTIASHLTDFMAGVSRRKDSCKQGTCTFIYSWILYLSRNNSNHETRRGKGVIYTPVCSLSSFLAFQSIRNRRDSSHLPHTPLLGLRCWIWMVNLNHVPSSQR